MADSVAPGVWTAPDRPIGVAILGAGARGASFARRLSALEGVRVLWLADLSRERMENAWVRATGPSPRFTGQFADPLGDPEVKAVFVTVPDHLHRQVACAAFAAGKHVFLEKPLATTPADAAEVVEAWRASGKVLRLGFVLRATPFYQAIREVIRAGTLGEVQSIRLSDDLSLTHGASYMRRWHRRSAFSGGLIVHKGCHDLDLVCWLLDSQPVQVASFGGGGLFARQAPARFCSQCPERAGCAYADSGAYEARTPQEAADPTAYGLDRCVYDVDRDIVENQVVAFEMSNGARGTFALAMQNPRRSERRILVLGSRGRLEGVFEDGRFEVAPIGDAPPWTWRAPTTRSGGHGGGDQGALIDFLDACLGRPQQELIDVKDALRGVVFAFAAEQARKAGAITRVADDLALLDGSTMQTRAPS